MSYTYDQMYNRPYMETTYQSGYPFYNYFRSNPLSETKSWIYPRQAGYNPYTKYTVFSQQSFIENKCATYQKSCDLILPSTSCYKETGHINHQP